MTFTNIIRRTRLRRYTWLKPGGRITRYCRIPRISAKRRADQAIWSAFTQTACELVNWLCQIRVPGICTGRATTGHHKLHQGQGGLDVLENCVPGCFLCHDWVERHTSWARKWGFTLKSFEAPKSIGGIL